MGVNNQVSSLPIPFNLLCVWILFHNASSQLCFRFFRFKQLSAIHSALIKVWLDYWTDRLARGCWNWQASLLCPHLRKRAKHPHIAMRKKSAKKNISSPAVFAKSIHFYQSGIRFTRGNSIRLVRLTETETAVARKKSRSFCQKCRWQVTAKHACTLRMWLSWSDMVHGCMVYT